MKPAMRAAKTVFTFISMLAILQACAPKALPPAEISDPKGMLEKIWRQSKPDMVFQAVASIRIESPEGTYATRAALIAAQPGFIRLETIPLFGTPDLLLTINKENMKAYFARQEKFYVGPPTKGISLFVPVALTPSEAVSMLKGSVPQSSFTPETRVRAFLDGDMYRLDVYPGVSRAMSVWTDRSSGRLIKMEIPGPETKLITYDDFREVGGGLFPGTIEVRSGQERVVRVKYGDMKLAPRGSADRDTFDLEIPEGVKPILIE